MKAFKFFIPILVLACLCQAQIPLTGAGHAGPAGGGGGGGPNFVNGGGDYSGGGSYTTSWSPTNGNTLIVFTGANDTTTTHTCSDGEGTGNSYVRDGSKAGTVEPVVGTILHASNISGTGPYTITCNGTTPFVAVLEISGNRILAATSAGTNPSSANSNASVITPAAFTPTAAATIQIDGYVSVAGGNVTMSQVDTNFTTNSSCTTGSSCFVGLMGYRVVGTSASYANGINTNDSGEGVVIHAAYQ